MNESNGRVGFWKNLNAEILKMMEPNGGPGELSILYFYLYKPVGPL
jgi:hypothetical protein